VLALSTGPPPGWLRSFFFVREPVEALVYAVRRKLANTFRLSANLMALPYLEAARSTSRMTSSRKTGSVTAPWANNPQPVLDSVIEQIAE
jgi:hypothetical protein